MSFNENNIFLPTLIKTIDSLFFLSIALVLVSIFFDILGNFGKLRILVLACSFAFALSQTVYPRLERFSNLFFWLLAIGLLAISYTNYYTSHISEHLLPVLFIIAALSIPLMQTHLLATTPRFFQAGKEKRFLYSPFLRFKSKFLCRLQFILKSEGYHYLIAVGLLAMIAFLFRSYNLDFLSFFRDELVHAVAAKRFMTEGIFYYSRTPQLTYSVVLMYKLFGVSVWSARILGVVLGSLSVILIYLVGRRVDKSVGLISAFALCFAPWSIGMARFLREYELNLFVMLLSIVLIMYSWDSLSQQIRAYINGDRFRFVSILPALLALLLISYFARSYDPTFKLVLGMLAFFVLARIVFEVLMLMPKKFYLISKIILLFVLLYLLAGSYNLPLKVVDEQRYFNIFFSVNNLDKYIHLFQWYEFTGITSITLIMIALLPLLFDFKDYFSYLATFSSGMVFLMYYFSWYFQERYAYYLLPFFVLMIASGIYSLAILGRLWLRKYSYTTLAACLVLVLVIFWPLTSAKLLLEEKSDGFDYKNAVYHFNWNELQGKLESLNYSEQDVLITANSHQFMFFYNFSYKRNDPSRDIIYENEGYLAQQDYAYNIYDYIYNRPYERTRLEEVIRRNDNGFIVIDTLRNRMWSDGWDPVNQTIHGKAVIYKGDFGGFDVFVWDLY